MDCFIICLLLCKVLLDLFSDSAIRILLFRATGNIALGVRHGLTGRLGDVSRDGRVGLLVVARCVEVLVGFAHAQPALVSLLHKITSSFFIITLI